MTLTKLCPECSKAEDTLTELEDGGYNCVSCKNQGRISVEISAVDIYTKYDDEQEGFGKQTFISTQDAKEIIEEIFKDFEEHKKRVQEFSNQILESCGDLENFTEHDQETLIEFEADDFKKIKLKRLSNENKM